MGAAEQPVSGVRWVERHLLHANDWNPNKVAPPELRLLELSILEDGWTQPIVTRPHDDLDGHFEIVDGFHRWTIAERPKIAALTDGLVPIVVTDPDPAQRRMSTVRHNRARGTHHVLRMADIVADLSGMDVDADELGRRLGMDGEEVRRLLDRGKMTKRGADAQLGEAWRPVPKEQEAPTP